MECTMTHRRDELGSQDVESSLKAWAEANGYVAKYTDFSYRGPEAFRTGPHPGAAALLRMNLPPAQL